MCHIFYSIVNKLRVEFNNSDHAGLLIVFLLHKISSVEIEVVITGLFKIDFISMLYP